METFEFTGEIVWRPTAEMIAQSNLKQFMDRHGLRSLEELERTQAMPIHELLQVALRNHLGRRPPDDLAGELESFHMLCPRVRRPRNRLRRSRPYGQRREHAEDQERKSDFLHAGDCTRSSLEWQAAARCPLPPGKNRLPLRRRTPRTSLSNPSCSD